MIEYNSNFGYARWFKMDVFILRCWHILLQIKNVADGLKLGLWRRWNFNSLLWHNIFLIYDYNMTKLGYFKPTYFNKIIITYNHDTTTHLGFYNRLIKWLLSFCITIVITSSYKGHCGVTWHYGFVIVVDITTWQFLHKYQNFKIYF
jgi:hypothetical protein